MGDKISITECKTNMKCFLKLSEISTDIDWIKSGLKDMSNILRTHDIRLRKVEEEIARIAERRSISFRICRFLFGIFGLKL